jgi:branched-chain amino acid transport system substrate-binding protein
MAVGGYDGMRVIYEAPRRPRRQRVKPCWRHEGPDFRKPAWPDVHRRADPRRGAQHLHPQGGEEGGQLYNQEFDTIKDVKDPGKAK